MESRKKLFCLIVASIVVLVLVGCEGLKEHTLTINVIPEGAGSVIPVSGSIYNEDTFVTLIPTANEGWLFKNWSGKDGAEIVQQESGDWVIFVDGDKEITAEFEEITKYVLSIDISPEGAGTVIPASGTVYNEETLVVLEPVADQGWIFEKWSGRNANEVFKDENGDWVIYIDGDKELVAEFEKVIAYTLTIDVSPEGAGTVTPASGTVYNEETLVILELESNEGWKFDKWGGADAYDVIKNQAEEWTIYVDNDKELIAEFVELSDVATLSQLKVFNQSDNELDLVPEFDANILEYEATSFTNPGALITYKTKFVFSPTDSNATIMLQDELVEPNEPTEYFNIKMGDNIFNIKVIAENQVTTQEYIVNVFLRNP